MRNKMIIIGSSGFIGSSLIDKLNVKKKVICFDKKNFKNKKNKEKIYKYYKSDISNIKNLNLALKNCNLVFYKASTLGGPQSANIKYAQQYIKNNVEKLKIFLNKLKNYKIKKIVYDSSFQIFGTKNNKNKEILPYNFYGLSKLAAEKILISWCKNNSVNLDILRYPRIIDQSNNNFISKMISDAYFKFKIIINDERKKFRIVHLKDVIKANLLSYKKINTGIRTLNISIKKEYNLLEIAKIIKSRLKSKIKIIVKKNIHKTNFEPNNVCLGKSFFYMPKEFKPKINIKEIIDKKIFELKKNEN